VKDTVPTVAVICSDASVKANTAEPREARSTTCPRHTHAPTHACARTWVTGGHTCANAQRRMTVHAWTAHKWTQKAASPAHEQQQTAPPVHATCAINPAQLLHLKNHDVVPVVSTLAQQKAVVAQDQLRHPDTRDRTNGPQTHALVPTQRHRTPTHGVVRKTPHTRDRDFGAATIANNATR
jgi:hypothetical protein